MEETKRVKLINVALILLKIWSRNLVDTWIEVLILNLKQSLPKSIEKDIEHLIVFLSENSQNFINKYVSVRMIGALAEVLIVIINKGYGALEK